MEVWLTWATHHLYLQTRGSEVGFVCSTQSLSPMFIPLLVIELVPVMVITVDVPTAGKSRFFFLYTYDTIL